MDSCTKDELVDNAEMTNNYRHGADCFEIISVRKFLIFLKDRSFRNSQVIVILPMKCFIYIDLILQPLIFPLTQVTVSTRYFCHLFHIAWPMGFGLLGKLLRWNKREFPFNIITDLN